MKRLIIPLLTLVLSACATVEERVQKVIATTPEEAAQRVTVKDDDLETFATFSTKEVFPWLYMDEYLRAFVDKKTGKVTLQTYFHATYTGTRWRHYHAVTYTTKGSPVTMPLQKIGHDVYACGGSRGCAYEEHFVFSLDERFARDMAAAYKPNTMEGWKLRFRAQASEDQYDTAIVASEIAGLLMRVDEYRRQKGFIR